MKKLLLMILVLTTFCTLAEDRKMGALGGKDLVKLIEGSIQSTYAIGGETSGFLLIDSNSDQRIEVDSDEREIMKLFLGLVDSGEEVIIKGEFRIVKGVERPLRNVFFVSKIYVNRLNSKNEVEEPVIIGMGGPLMYNFHTKACVQSLSTLQTKSLKDNGFVPVSICPTEN